MCIEEDEKKSSTFSGKKCTP